MRKFILRCDNTENDALNAYKKLNIKKCIYLYIVINAWNDITNSTIKNDGINYYQR